MEECEPLPSSEKEVLIIPLHPSPAPSSPTNQTSGLSIQQTSTSASSTHQTSSTVSHQITSTTSISSPLGTAGLGPQLFAELLESQARRSPRTASPEPSTTPPNEATPPNKSTSPSTNPVPPQHLSLSPQPSTPPQQLSPSTQGGGQGLSSPELLKELKQPHALKHVSAHKGLTTVFSGRGRVPSSTSPNGDSMGGGKPSRLSNGIQH